MAKKKSNKQQDSQPETPKQGDPNTNPKVEPTNPNPTAIEDPVEKLSTLKSLNAMLLKETVEKRQEVSALLESKKSLESELTRSVSEIEALKAELVQVQEIEDLKREKREVETKLEDLEREMSDVVRERNEMEKAKFAGDLEIGSMKKLENELRNEIKRGRDVLNQKIHENDVLKHDLGSHVEEKNRLKEKLAQIESKYAEELRVSKSKHESVAKDLTKKENEIALLRVELGSLGRNRDELKREIDGLNAEKDSMLREKSELSRRRSEQDVRIGELEEEVCKLNAIVLSLREDEEKWRVKFFELEKINAEMADKIEDLGRELNVSMQENATNEKEIKGLMGEKLSAVNSLVELEKELETAKQDKEQFLKEKNLLEKAKSEQQNLIVELRDEVTQLQGNVSLLKESNHAELEKNRKLLSEVDNFKNMLDRVKIERDDAKKALEVEKANGAKLQVKVSEISKKMEETAKVIEELRAMGNTLVAEKKELEKKHISLMEENGYAGRKFADAQKKVAQLEASLKEKNDAFEGVVEVLKKTALQLSMEEDDNKKMAEMSKKRGVEPYLSELETIRSAFRKREEKVGEMAKQMESLQFCVDEARKKKSFWALVSSATTILAAVVSFAYATSSSRAH